MINKIHYADIFKRRNKFFSFIYGFKKEILFYTLINIIMNLKELKKLII